MASDARIERAARELWRQERHGGWERGGEGLHAVFARAAEDILAAAGPSEDEARLMRERDQARADWDQAIVAWRAAQRERDEAREAAGHLRDSLERLTKAVHNWNVALEIDDAGEIYAVNCELEAAVIAADEQLGGGGQ